MSDVLENQFWFFTHIKMYGLTYMFFSAIFSKRDNFSDFLFASLDNETFSKRGLLLKERICSDRSRFLPVAVDPH